MRIAPALLLITIAVAAGRSARGGEAAAVPVDPEPVSIMGHLVESRTSKDLGRVVDVLVDHDGKPVVAILDVGGFLGVGTRRVAVAWNALHFSAAGGNKLTVAIDIPSDEIKAAPAYEAGKPIKALADEVLH
jgi:hypothetical protein